MCCRDRRGFGQSCATREVELLRVNRDQAAAIRAHLAGVHPPYVTRLDELLARADEQTDR
jgi:hypothetical protein